MKPVIILSFIFLFATPFAEAQTRKAPAKLVVIEKKVDCVGDCNKSNIITAVAPIQKEIEISGPVQIVAAAENLKIENPNEVKIKSYRGYIQITENPLNVIELTIDGKKKYMVKIEDEKLYQPLKKGDLVIVERSQFFVMDKNTTFKFKTIPNKCGITFTFIVGHEMENCYGYHSPKSFDYEGILARDLDGNIIKTSNGYIAVSTNSVTKNEDPYFISVYEKFFSEVGETYTIGEKIAPRVVIPKVKIANIGGGN